MLANKYNLIEKISEGQFGAVFKGQHIRTKEYVAIKFELTNDLNSLKNEAKIYHYLSHLEYFPHLKWFGIHNNAKFIAIDLLGQPLSHIIKHTWPLNLDAVTTIGIQMIQRLQTLHEHFLLHRDIKPDNFLFGLNDTNKLYLIDFGLCKRYDFNGIHIEQKRVNNIIGSPNFISIHVHQYMEPGRRDDLESCIYIILYMLIGPLEWFGTTDMETMYRLKRELTFKADVPLVVRDVLRYIRTLQFSDTPDYEYIIQLLKNN